MPDRLTIDLNARERVSALAYRAGDESPSMVSQRPGRGEEERIGATFVLAHGAGAGQLSPFMVRMASGLASRGLDVLTFNFAYTESRRRLPDRPEKLEACYRAVLAAAQRYAPFDGNALLIGGKSMGGRIASHVAAGHGGDAAPDVRGLIFLGYPLHPPGKPDQLRAAHLPNIRVPMLFIQGARDPFGTPEELTPILDRLGARVTLHAIENGNHSLATPKKSPVSAEAVFQHVQDTIAQWAKEVTGP